MSPFVTSTLGVIFVLVAAVQVWLMLEDIGREHRRFSSKVISTIHRWNGRLFVLIYLLLCVVMVQRVAESNAGLDARMVMHFVLAISILPILTVKILIVRYYPNAFKYVFAMGIAILAISLALVGITGGYYFIKSATGKYISVFNPKAGYLDVDVGRQIVIQKCAKCHDLTRVFTMAKTPQSWMETVNRMAQRDPTWLSNDQIQQAVYFLSERQNITRPEEVTTVQLESILQTRCSKCHSLERAFARRRTSHEWKILVKRMSNRHRGWIDDAEAQVLGDYMARLYGIKDQPAAAASPATPAPKPAAINFSALFESNGCIFCHGEKGEGEAAGTPNWTDAGWQGSRTDEELIESITNGKGKDMPKFAGILGNDEIQAAVKFVRGFRRR